MTMHLLVNDLLRRGWKWTPFMVLFSAFMFWFAMEMGEPTRALGASMGWALTMRHYELRFMARPIWYLPVSKRDIWKAGWLVMTIATGLALTAGKFIAMVVLLVAPSLDVSGASPVLTFPTIALSAVYDFVAAGFGCALLILLTRPQPPAGTAGVLASIARGMAEMVLAAGFLAGVYGGKYLSGWLPARWSELGPMSGVLLVAGVALSIATYFHSPMPPALARESAAAAAAERKPVRARSLARGGLSGLPRLLVHEYGVTISIGAGLSLASLLVVMVMTNVLQSPRAVADLLRDELRFIDGVGASSPPGLNALVALTWFGFFVGSLAARFPSMLRHLRVLPITAMRLNVMLVAWPALIWLTAGLALAVTRYFLIGEGPPAAHVPLFIALTGLSAIAGALTLRVSGLPRVFLLAMVLGLSPLLHLLPVPQPGVLLLLGLGALTAAAALNHVTLRRSATYRISHAELAAASARFGL